MRGHVDVTCQKSGRIVPYCLIALGVVLICLAFANHKSGSVVKAEASVILQWQDAAHEANVPELLIDRVAGLIAEGFGASPDASEPASNPDIRDSLKRFIGEFRWAFADSLQGSEFSHYFAWLVLEAVRRERPSQDALMRAREDFCKCVETLGTRLRDDLRERLGLEYTKYEEAIETGILQTRETLIKRFTILQADPLFPSLKGPLAAETVELAVRFAADPGQYDLVFSGPVPMMVEEDRVYIRRLENFFETLPKELLFRLVQADIDERLRLNPYWGPVDYTMISTSRDYHWPMQGVLHIHQKGAQIDRK